MILLETPRPYESLEFGAIPLLPKRRKVARQLAWAMARTSSRPMLRPCCPTHGG